MITVHHLNNSKSQRIVWLLEELGLTYELVHHTRQPTLAAPPEMRDIHPLGKAPIVEIDGHIMAESGAVVEYIVHRFGAGRLMPDPASEDYALYLEMLHYPEGSANLPSFLNLVVGVMGLADTPLATYAEEQAALHYSYMNGLLEGREWLLGDLFTAADIQLSFIVFGAGRGGRREAYPNLVSYVERLQARPGWQAAIERGGPFDLSFGQD